MTKDGLKLSIGDTIATSVDDEIDGMKITVTIDKISLLWTMGEVCVSLEVTHQIGDMQPLRISMTDGDLADWLRHNSFVANANVGASPADA